MRSGDQTITANLREPPTSNPPIARTYCIKLNDIFSDTKTQQTKVLKMYFYESWPDFGIPENSQILIDMILQIQEQNFNRIVVHCSAGVGRTGTFLALNRLIYNVKHKSKTIDIFGTVLSLRNDRRMMVSLKT